MFALFVDSIGGTAAKGAPEGFSDNKHVLVDSRGSGDPCKTCSCGLIRQSSLFLISAPQNSVRSMFLQFLYIVERGTPGKRVPEGFFDKVCISIFAAQNRVRSM